MPAQSSAGRDDRRASPSQSGGRSVCFHPVQPVGPSQTGTVCMCRGAPGYLISCRGRRNLCNGIVASSPAQKTHACGTEGVRTLWAWPRSLDTNFCWIICCASSTCRRTGSTVRGMPVAGFNRWSGNQRDCREAVPADNQGAWTSQVTRTGTQIQRPSGFAPSAGRRTGRGAPQAAPPRLPPRRRP